MANGSAAPRKKGVTVALVMMVLVILALAGARLWLEKQITMVPYPYWLAVSENGMAVVYGDTIYVCNAEGAITKKIPIPDYIVPCQVAWQNDKLLVADWKNDALQSFGTYGMTTMRLQGGPNIAAHLNAVVNESNDVFYVSDSQGNHVHIYDSMGNYLRSFGGFGLTPGSLLSPKDIRLLNDTLYVGRTMVPSGVDAFSTYGKFMKTVVKPKGNILYNLITDFDLTENHIVTIECDMLYAHCLIASYNWDGKLLGKKPQPTGVHSVGDIAIRDDIVYVSDAANRVITKYDAATLENLGPASLALNRIGESDSKKYLILKQYSKYTLIALILCAVLVAVLYWQYKKSS